MRTTLSRAGSILVLAGTLCLACSPLRNSSESTCRTVIEYAIDAHLSAAEATGSNRADARDLLSRARQQLRTAEYVCAGTALMPAVEALAVEIETTQNRLNAGRGAVADQAPTPTRAWLQPVTTLAQLVPPTPTAAPIQLEDTFDLKGVYLGVPIDTFRRMRIAARCSDVDKGAFRSLVEIGFSMSPGEDICSLYGATIADAKSIHMYYFLDRRLYRIHSSFSQSAYGRVRAAMIHKFGGPGEVETMAYSNAMGAAFTGEVAVWRKGRLSATLTERSGDLTESSLTMVDEDVQREAFQRTPASSDL